MTFTGFTKGLHVFAVCNNMLTFSGLQISAYVLMCSPIPLVKPISVIHSFNTFSLAQPDRFFSFILGRERKRSGCARLTPIAQIMQGDDF